MAIEASQKSKKTRFAWHSIDLGHTRIPRSSNLVEPKMAKTRDDIINIDGYTLDFHSFTLLWSRLSPDSLFSSTFPHIHGPQTIVLRCPCHRSHSHCLSLSLSPDRVTLNQKTATEPRGGQSPKNRFFSSKLEENIIMCANGQGRDAHDRFPFVE